MIAKSKKQLQLQELLENQPLRAMLFQILLDAGLEPSIISGAGLTRVLSNKEKLAMLTLGKEIGSIIEADESDGSVVQYEPEIGLYF